MEPGDSTLIDKQLLASGFTITQLIELSGLSIAQSINLEIPSHQNILCLIGPGNNGSDGLATSRYLQIFGHKVHIKVITKVKHPDLLKLALEFECFLVDHELDIKEYDYVVDALFGVVMNRELSTEYLKIIENVKESRVVSIDVATGNIDPFMLVSLTAPKIDDCGFKGVHYLCGRFLNPKVIRSTHNAHLGGPIHVRKSGGLEGGLAV